MFILQPLQTAFEQFPISSILSVAFALEGLLIMLFGAKHNKGTGLILIIVGVGNLYLIGLYVVTLYGVSNIVVGLINMILVCAGFLLAPFIQKEPRE